MILPYNFNELPGFSKIFIDFLYSKSDLFLDRFPANNPNQFELDFLKKRAKAFNKRFELVQLIENSMGSIQLTEKQDYSLKSLSQEHTLVVATSCFPGFFFGTLVQVWKAFTIIAFSIELESIHPDVRFVPILWVDDDSIGSSEVIRAYYYDSLLNLTFLEYVNFLKINRNISIANVYFDKIIEDLVSAFEATIKLEEKNPELMNFIYATYKSGVSWCESFVNSMNYFFGKKGLLFARSSIARKNFMFADFVQKEIKLFHQSNEIVQSNLLLLNKYGYQFKTKFKKPNLQFHKGEEIIQIECADNNSFRIGEKTSSSSELFKLISSSPDLFSPNVMLKPVLQSFIMPIIAMVVSPSEISYFLLLREIFEIFGVPIPLILPRYSASLIPTKVFRNLDLKSIENNPNRIIKDLIQQLKKQRLLFNFLFPKKNLQERKITPFYFLAETGKIPLLECLDKLMNQSNQYHYIIFC